MANTNESTNLNIRVDKDVKEQAEEIFSKLGLNMTTAINMFLRTAIREEGIPFELSLDTPKDKAIRALEVQKKILQSKGHSDMEDLVRALNE